MYVGILRRVVRRKCADISDNPGAAKFSICRYISTKLHGVTYKNRAPFVEERTHNWRVVRWKDLDWSVHGNDGVTTTLFVWRNWGKPRMFRASVGSVRPNLQPNNFPTQTTVLPLHQLALSPLLLNWKSGYRVRRVHSWAEYQWISDRIQFVVTVTKTQNCLPCHGFVGIISGDAENWRLKETVETNGCTNFYATHKSCKQYTQVESTAVIASSNGLNTLCRNKRVLL
jgi:hypothetical protein